MQLPTLTRRSALASIAATAITPSALFASSTSDLAAALSALEQKSRGRLGVSVLFPNGKRVSHRPDERFPMCSTFKFLAASLILQRVDQGKEHLDRIVSYSKADLVTYSPETEKHVGSGMTVTELCKAALTLSDNTAANLLLASFGGPPAITAFARSVGDNMTRLDRNETALNESIPGDPRDTTTPNSMLGNLQKILFGDVLKPNTKKQLTDWMLANTTGKTKFVAGLPADWKVADKTGSGEHGSNNDIGALYPPTSKPILITSYLTQTDITTEERNTIHADIARAVATEVH
ncbi:MAG TPA: class A beta-lactamase [Edaphobacter sp.]|jgi:beta-lactamase class A|nr:class A beta-lactamase [Edaphobacter sp.]